MKAIWREELSISQVNLIDETARCLANQQATATNGQLPNWKSLTSEEQENVAGHILSVFLAQGQAMHNLIKRGEVP